MSVEANHVEGEAIDLIFPNMQIHSYACNEECHENYKANVKKCLDQEFGIDAPITIWMVKPPLLRSSAKRGAKGVNNATTVSQPERLQGGI